MSTQTQTTKWYQGTGFYVAAIMASFGFITGLQEQDVSEIVTYAFGISGSILAVRQKVKDSGIDFKRWITNPNTMSYLGTALVAIVPQIPFEVFGKLNDIITAAINKNYSALLAGVFSVATMIYFALFSGRKSAKA